MQLTTAKNTETTEDEYLDMVPQTAVLSPPGQFGAVVAGAERKVRAAFRSYGANLGIAFQLIDDALDSGGQYADSRQGRGDDFREGKVTLPVVLAYRRGTDAEREFWGAHACERGDAEDDLAEAISLLERRRAPERYGRARPPLRRHGARRARSAADEPVQDCAFAGGNILLARAH